MWDVLPNLYVGRVSCWRVQFQTSVWDFRTQDFNGFHGCFHPLLTGQRQISRLLLQDKLRGRVMQSTPSTSLQNEPMDRHRPRLWWNGILMLHVGKFSKTKPRICRSGWFGIAILVSNIWFCARDTPTFRPFCTHHRFLFMEPAS